MLAGYWNYCTGYVKGFLSYRRGVGDVAPSSSPLDDPEVLLQQAQWEMKENQARTRAVQAITQKNHLQALADQHKKTVANLEDKIEFAQFKGDDKLVEQLQVERDRAAATLATTNASLQIAVDTTEAVKVAMRREEERIHAKTAQALALQALWKQCQIEALINKATAQDPDEGLTQIGYLTRALILHTRKVRDDLETQAARAERTGNGTLADRLRAARDEFQSGLCA